MGKITKIKKQKNNPKRVSVYIDGQFCTGMEERVLRSLNLKVGDEINCEDLRREVKLFWKNRYKDKWKEEKSRILTVIYKLKKFLKEDIDFEVFGFGAGSDKLIESHPVEKGIPDLAVVYKKGNFSYVLLFIEVTGTNFLNEEDDLWIRPDKFEFAKRHSNMDVWIAHYINDLDLLRFISTKNLSDLGKPKEVTIRNNKEEYLSIPVNHKSVQNIEQFIRYLQEKIDYIK